MRTEFKVCAVIALMVGLMAVPARADEDADPEAFIAAED